MVKQIQNIFEEEVKEIEKSFETKRNLAELNFTRPFDGTDCSVIDEEDQCNSGINCTWCESNQQPSGCFLLSSSIKLPPKIYQCDKQPGFVYSFTETPDFILVDGEISPDQEPEEEEDHHKHHHKHHGHHGKKKGCGCCHAVPAVIVLIIMIVHIVFLKKQLTAIEARDKLTGNDSKGWWGKWKKNCGQK